ncbi:hypothetical protein QYE76_055352 [Lolium multiflorum]|uniref:Reverse transcriptase Ty1/copia-type domain-containing protein n=1 Tax=Lolium multiflorum TaxID=4521 RepID=A0AAD8WNW4_LOLMU|nr:hypothetical protein QYE76_055352 [Lolium multiflorum]
MSHIPKNKNKALNPLSKTMMMIKKHPQLMFKLKLSLMINFEPLKVHEALVDPDWVIAMQEELECFTRNEVWSLVERPKDHRINVIGTKWVFKNKQDENGIVIRNKARKFEMSMMGELKFFLGFQVRQLAKGTFISQEKYVKDMLKKFNMTNASPMKTPMPVKGQLGSCDGEKDVDIKDLRTVNPYRYEQRTYTGGDKFFWTKTQAALWDGFYNTQECMKNGAVVKPKAINPEELALHEATKYRFVVETLKAMDRMTPNYAQYVQWLINSIVPAPLNTLDERVIMAPFKFPTQEGRPEVPSMIPSNERRSKEQHDPAASSSYSRCPKHGAARFFSSMWQMCKNTNDVAHQSLALNQETRRRQNEFMATRNAPVPPSGPEMAPVVAPQWEMPPLLMRCSRISTSPCMLMVVFLLGLLVLLLLLRMMVMRMKVMRLRVMMARAPTPSGMSSIDGCDSISPLSSRCSDAKGGEESRV